MLVVDILRGKHSTGVATATYNGVTTVIKKALNAVDMLDLKSYKDEMLFGHNLLIGHNRYATKGAINNVNAHPFEFDRVVGAHNGTLRAYNQLDDAKDFDVDSECLYNHINDNGFQDAFEKVTGAFALSWFDKETKELNLVRNDERPLYYCYSDDFTTLFWASEHWMLLGILARNGIKHTELVNLKVDNLYRFKMPEVFNTKNVVLDAPTIREYKKPKPKTTPYVHKAVNNGARTSDFRQMKVYKGTEVSFCVDDHGKDYTQTPFIEGFLTGEEDVTVRVYTPEGRALWCQLLERRDLATFKAVVKDVRWAQQGYYLEMELASVEEVGNVIEGKFSDISDGTLSDGLDEGDGTVTVEGFSGQKLTYTEFKQATKKGCAWCGDIAIFNAANLFIADDEHVCPVCAKEEEVLGYLQEAFNIGEL